MVATNMKQHHQYQRKMSATGRQTAASAETVSIGSTRSAKLSGSSLETCNSFTTNNTQSHSSAISNSKTRLNSRQGSQESVQDQKNGSILNVAEMLLHGVADNEILDIWLRSIQCERFLDNFINAGYDMPTISRITPQDLTAIGVTDPTKRLKILTEIKKLNLQDGIPDFKPATLSHWLSLIRLDTYYYQSLCDQQVDTIEKACQLTWEDFEELGITRLGHQKRFQLAIERVKEVDANASKRQTKPMSEPIYDTNPSQILLVASAENHSMNGPIINKQSSTSELSSTGSGSMHSVYSAASAQYYQSHSNYAPFPGATSATPIASDSQQKLQQQSQSQPLPQPPQPPPPPPNSQPPPSQQQMEIQRHHQQPCNNNPQQLGIQQQQHPIYNQPLQPHPPLTYNQLANNPSVQQQSHYQHPQIHPQSHLASSQTPFQQNGSITPEMNKSMLQHQHTLRNRQSMSQLPLAALSRLPLHQQQLLQQGSIYATLSRQPSTRPKQPPPVPLRTNSLKPASMESNHSQQGSNIYGTLSQPQQLLASCNATSTTSLFKTGSTLSSSTQVNPSHQAMLSKNKSFSGGAMMEASRARFQNQNNHLHQPQPLSQLQTQSQSLPMSQPLPQSQISKKPSLFNATLGHDDDFPPPPSPLSIVDCDDNASVPIGDTSSANFMNINHGLLSFRVGI